MRVEGDTVASFALRSLEHCRQWNTEEFFRNATPQEARDCLDAGADINARDDFGQTPLHFAASLNENPQVAAALIQAGADINARRDDGRTPLGLANEYENPDVAEVIRAAGGR